MNVHHVGGFILRVAYIQSPVICVHTIQFRIRTEHIYFVHCFFFFFHVLICLRPLCVGIILIFIWTECYQVRETRHNAEECTENQTGSGALDEGGRRKVGTSNLYIYLNEC